MSEALLARLIDFAESGNQQKIELHNQLFQGWIMEITEEGLLISTGYSDKKGKDHWLSLTDLRQASLYFWDNKTNHWTQFQL